MTLIITLLLVGILLLLLEIFVIPGVGVVGVLGVGVMGFAIWMAYDSNPITGHIALAVALVASIISLTLGLRGNTWQRVALKSEIDGKVNTEIEEQIHVGDFGTTTSRLMPAGKARINDMYVEVHSQGQFIAQNTDIEVIKVDHTKIIVKPKE
jgi:membrane-bound ClpP family serine protease